MQEKQIVQIKKEHLIYRMSGNNEPVIEAENHDILEFETADCYGGQLDGAEENAFAMDWSQTNPATGPVFIKGAEPGDTLKIEILDITVDTVGKICAFPGEGLLGDHVKEVSIKKVSVRDGKVHFSDTICFPVNHMIGVIGIAPAQGEIPCGEPGHHGGNMDNKRISTGTVLYLPVFKEGGLLSIGDIHSAMGDGEIMVTGVETHAKVTVRVSILKGVSITDPILEDDTHLYTIYSDKEFMNAARGCTEIMNRILQKTLELSYNEAGMLLSAAGDLKICQVVDPLITVTMAVPKSIFPKDILSKRYSESEKGYPGYGERVIQGTKSV